MSQRVPQQLQIGLYYRSSPGYYDDVDPKEPTSFTTDLSDPVFPSTLLNTSLSGSAGTAGINQIFKWDLGGMPIPKIEGDPSRQETGVSGHETTMRVKKHPNILRTELVFPDVDIDDVDYDSTWEILKQITYSKVMIWVLHMNWAFRGYIANCDDVFQGRYVEDNVLEIAFGIKRFYRPTSFGGNRRYVIFDPS